MIKEEVLMMGWQLQILQNVCPTVYQVKKAARKVITERSQAKQMRELYKNYLRTKYNRLTDDDYSFIAEWNNYTTC